jgi:hypothetical protein
MASSFTARRIALVGSACKKHSFISTTSTALTLLVLPGLLATLLKGWKEEPADDDVTDAELAAAE